jgi:hypothetical protein
LGPLLTLCTRPKMSQRVLASAVVDVLRDPPPKGLGTYKVEVWGKPPFDFVRTYEIQAKSDNIAAREGIDRFVSEMEAMDGRAQS